MRRDLDSLGNEDLSLERLLRFWRRFVAAATCYTGQLDVIRKTDEAAGGAPWRIVRYPRTMMPEHNTFPLLKTDYVRPWALEKHFAYLAKRCRVVRLDALLEMLESGEKVPSGTVALTFDGGWEEHFRIAAPLLRKYGLPATFLVPTAFIDTHNLFWTDKVLIALMLMREKGLTFPPLVSLEKRRLEPLLTLAPQGQITLPFIALFIETLKSLEVEQRFFAFAELGTYLDAVENVELERTFMTWEEVKKLSSESLFCIGSMGHGHQIASDLRPEDLAADLRESYVKLNQEKIEFSKAFCFPEGMVTDSARETLYKLGVRYSLTIGFPRQNLEEGRAQVLGRVPMYQDVSFAADLFACRLWGVSTWGVTF